MAEVKINVVKLLEQIRAVYHGGPPPYDLIYDQLMLDGHKIEYPQEKEKMWNLAQYNSKDYDGAVILYKSYLVKKYLFEILPTQGKVVVVDIDDPKQIPLSL